MPRTKNTKKPRSRAQAPARKAPRRKTTTPKLARANAPSAGPIPKGELAPCHFCKKMVDKSECYCYGCRHVICEECEGGNHPDGHGHSVEEHRLEPEHFSW